MKTGKKAEFLDPNNHEFHLDDQSRIYSGSDLKRSKNTNWYKSRTLHVIILNVIILCILFFTANFYGKSASPKIVLKSYAYDLKAYSLNDKVRVFVSIQSTGATRAGGEVEIIFSLDDGQSAEYTAMLPGPGEGSITIRHIFNAIDAKKVSMVIVDGNQKKKIQNKIIPE